MSYRLPRPLADAHDLQSFLCASAEQTEWLVRHARLGVHRDHEGRGLGAGSLRDVIARVAAISEDIGCRGLLVQCESEQAREFSLHLAPEFEASQTDELHWSCCSRTSSERCGAVLAGPEWFQMERQRRPADCCPICYQRIPTGSYARDGRRRP